MTAPWVEADWPAPRGVRALSTLRGDPNAGVSAVPYASFNLGGHVGDDPIAVAENRRRLRLGAGLPAEPAWLSQVHGVAVADLDRAGTLAPADAAVARGPNRVAAILTADCLPIVLAADSGDIVAAAHAGWRGLAAGVIEATVRAMGVPPAALMAWLGPAIGPKHFEVGPEVREAFLSGDSQAGGGLRAQCPRALSGRLRRARAPPLKFSWCDPHPWRWALHLCPTRSLLLAPARRNHRPPSHADLAGTLKTTLNCTLSIPIS